MAHAWSVDDHRIEWRFQGRKGSLLIDGVRDETCQIKLSRPNHQFRLGERTLVLKTYAGVAELWCRGLAIPPVDKHLARIAAPEGCLCALHPQLAAVIACSVCGTFCCSTICQSVDGTRCVKCLGTFTEADASAQVLAYSGPGAGITFLGADVGPMIGYFGPRLIALVLAAAFVFLLTLLRDG